MGLNYAASIFGLDRARPEAAFERGGANRRRDVTRFAGSLSLKHAQSFRLSLYHDRPPVEPAPKRPPPLRVVEKETKD
jgi:hypothetical protein